MGFSVPSVTMDIKHHFGPNSIGGNTILQLALITRVVQSVGVARPHTLLVRKSGIAAAMTTKRQALSQALACRIDITIRVAMAATRRRA